MKSSTVLADTSSSFHSGMVRGKKEFLYCSEFVSGTVYEFLLSVWRLFTKFVVTQLSNVLALILRLFYYWIKVLFFRYRWYQPLTDLEEKSQAVVFSTCL